MFLVGLTGGIATGKSTASNMFRVLGIPVIDADKIARDVVQPGMPAWKAIREQFGEDVFLEDGQLDRAKMGNIVFSDADKRRQLNGITHKEIRGVILWEIFLCYIKGYQFVVLDLPLLFESRNMISFVSYIVVVSCTEGQQLQRLMARNQFSREEAESRINSQMPLMEKRRLASYVVDNSGTREMTEKQVLDLYNKFRHSRAHWPMRILGLMSLGLLVWIGLKIIGAFL
ncbi:dephospho-CoA kinase domain-containing protein-like [Babylonia areolata]|uniref:dephospho-CoA kinase domain-containing protein-like n=1 Tax=Babylonia areolata TaxID=304850 RepID=UPI003FD43980